MVLSNGFLYFFDVFVFTDSKAYVLIPGTRIGGVNWLLYTATNQDLLLLLREERLFKKREREKNYKYNL